MTRQVPVYGQVESVNAVTIGFQVAGTVQEVAVTQGQVVKQGDTLAMLDTSELYHKLTALDDRDKQLRDKIQQVEAEEKKQSVQVLKNAHALSLAEQHFNKQKKLQSERIITKAQLEEAAFRLDERKSIHLQSVYEKTKIADKLILLKSHVRKVKQDRSEVERWIKQSRLTASFSGKIDQVFVQPGQKLTTKDKVLTLFDQTKMRIRAVVAHAEVRELKRQLQKKHLVPVKIAWSEQVIDGKITDILPYSTSETLGVDVLIDVGDQLHRLDRTAQRYMMIVPTFRRLFTVPSDAIQDGGFVVKVSESGSIQRAAVIKIRPATVNKQHVVVESEQLQSDDQIVIASQVPVHVGDLVINHQEI